MLRYSLKLSPQFLSSTQSALREGMSACGPTSAACQMCCQDAWWPQTCCAQVTPVDLTTPARWDLLNFSPHLLIWLTLMTSLSVLSTSPHRETPVAHSSVGTGTGWPWWAWSAGATGVGRRINLGSTPVSPITSAGSTEKLRQIRSKARETAERMLLGDLAQEAQWVKCVYHWEGRQRGPQDSCLSVDLTPNWWRFLSQQDHSPQKSTRGTSGKFPVPLLSQMWQELRIDLLFLLLLVVSIAIIFLIFPCVLKVFVCFLSTASTRLEGRSWPHAGLHKEVTAVVDLKSVALWIQRNTVQFAQCNKSHRNVFANPKGI